MKKIPLRNRLGEVVGYALVDDADYQNVKHYRWSRDGKYVSAWVGGRMQRLHRVLCAPDKGEYIDHRNGDGTDNRRRNLRVCTNRQNGMNSKKRINSASQYKGVGWHKKSQRWRARIVINGKSVHLGHFQDEREAAKAYADAAHKYFGEFARTTPIV